MKKILFIIAVTVFLGCECEELTVGIEQERKPDLSISSIDISELGCSEGECSISALITIHNGGVVTAKSFFVSTIFDPQNSGMHTIFVDSLESGESKDILAISDATGFCYDPDCGIKSIVDSENTVMESNESNNELEENFSGFDFPDFSFFDKPFLDSNCFDDYEPCQIYGSIKNIGDGNNSLFGSVTVSFYHDDFPEGIHVGLGVLEVNEVKSFEITIPGGVFCQQGCEITLIIDEKNHIPELLEDNNTENMMF